MRLDDIVKNMYVTDFKNGKFKSRAQRDGTWFDWPDSEIEVLKKYVDAYWNRETKWMEFTDLAKAMLILL